VFAFNGENLFPDGILVQAYERIKRESAFESQILAAELIEQSIAFYSEHSDLNFRPEWRDSIVKENHNDVVVIGRRKKPRQ